MNNKIDDFKPASKTDDLSAKEVSILEKNKKFFSSDYKYIQSMLDIINGESTISIRLLDWFVANYSKSHNTFYKNRINERVQLFYVHSEYRNQLHGYSKKYFDPFCRKNSKKVIYKYNGNNRTITFLTSIGQLNFFQWALRYKIIKYVQLHLKQIETDMKETNKLNKERKILLEEDEEEDDENNDSSEDKVQVHTPDPNICSDQHINSFRISTSIKSGSKSSSKSSSKSNSEKRRKRQQLSVSMLDTGIKKYNIPIKLDFE